MAQKWLIPALVVAGLAVAAGWAYKQFKGDGITDKSTGAIMSGATGYTFDSTGNKAVDKAILRTERTSTRQSEKTDRAQIRNETVKDVFDTIASIFKKDSNTAKRSSKNRSVRSNPPATQNTFKLAQVITPSGRLYNVSNYVKPANTGSSTPLDNPFAPTKKNALRMKLTQSLIK